MPASLDGVDPAIVWPNQIKRQIAMNRVYESPAFNELLGAVLRSIDRGRP